MSKPFDTTLKQLFDEAPTPMVGWLCAAAKIPVAASATPIDAELSTITLAADKVFRLSDPPGGLLHVEAQSSRDPDFGQRIHEYNTILHSRHGGVVRSVALLLRRDAAPGVTGVYQLADEDGQYLTFRYRVVKLWDEPLASVMAGPVEALPLAVLTDGGAASIPAVLGQIQERFDQAKVPQSKQDMLWSASFLLCGLRFDDPDIVNWFKGVQGMEESTTYQWILRQGEARGKEVGIQIGKEEGKLDARRVDLLDSLEAKFGGTPPDIEKQILAETDPERLRVALQSLFRIGSITEFKL